MYFSIKINLRREIIKFLKIMKEEIRILREILITKYKHKNKVNQRQRANMGRKSIFCKKISMIKMWILINIDFKYINIIY